MATKFISFANNQRFLRVTNSRTNTITYVSKVNLVIEKDNYESFYIKNDDFIKYYKYKDILYPSSRDMSNLVTKLVDICQGDAATENMLLDEIKRSPVVTELKVFDKDPYERVFCTKTEALVIHSTNGTHIEKMNKEFDGSTDLSTFRLDIYGRTRDYDGVNLSDYTMGSLVGFNIGYDSNQEQMYEFKLAASDGIRFATSTYPTLKRRIIQQSKEYVDIPMGKTRIAVMSAAMLKGPADEVATMGDYVYDADSKKLVFTSRVGMFNDIDDISGISSPNKEDYKYSNGIYFEYSRELKEDDGDFVTDDTKYDAGVVSPDIINNLTLVLMVNGRSIRIPQSNFNIDRVNGTGPSGVIFDPTRITTFMFKFGNMNDTVITAGLFNEGSMILVHTFVDQDLKDFNYSAKLPIRWDFEVVSSIQSASSKPSVIIDDYVMLRGSGAVYSNETLDIFNENKTFLLPVKKNFVDSSTVASDSHAVPNLNNLEYHSMNPAIRVFKTLTPLFNKDIMFGIRLREQYRRNKVQLRNIVFQSDDSTPKTVLWKVIRNGKYRRLMWRLNIPELRQNRSLNMTYTNLVGVTEFVTPNDVDIHRAQTLPVLLYDHTYAQNFNLSDSDNAWEDSHTRDMRHCAFDGSYDKVIDNMGNTEKRYVDLIQVEDPTNDRFTYQYFEGNDKNTAFGHIESSMCELWSMESSVGNLDSTNFSTQFEMIPNEGKYYVDNSMNDPSTPIVMRYNGVDTGSLRNYASPFVNDYNAKDIFDVEETYTSKPNIQASGIAQFTNYTTIDISNMTPFFSDIEGKSDEYVLQVEFGPNSVSDVNLQTAVNWIEYQ
jgi:hypothetical protein